MENEIYKNIKFDNIVNIIYDNCTFIDCDFSNTNILDASFLNTQFIGCKMLGITIDYSYLKNTTFKECKMDLFSICDSNITNVSFISSSLKEGKLYNNKLSKKNYIFENNDMSNISINDDLKGVSLISNNISGINIKNIKGTIISSDQAIILCGLLGVKVKI